MIPENHTDLATPSCPADGHEAPAGRTARAALFVGRPKSAVATAAFFAFAVALFAFLAAPQLGSAYLRLIGPLGTDLPVPTVDVALPLLRVAPGGPHQEAVTSPGAAAVLLGLLLPLGCL